MKKRHAWIALLGVAVPALGSSFALAASSTTNGGWSWDNSGSTVAIEGTTWHLGSERAATPSGSGVTVSIVTSGVGAGIAAGDQALSARGGTDGMYTVTNASSVGAQVVTTDTGCTYGQMCSNRGQFEIRFSQPMTDPIIHLSGIGGGGYDSGSNGKTTAWTELELLTAGVTMTLLTQQNLQLVGNRLELTVKNPTTRCNSVSNDYGATASAGCGSVRLNGTFSSVVFRADLNSVNNANPYVNGQLEDAFIIAVTIDPAAIAATTTAAPTTTVAPTTTTTTTTVAPTTTVTTTTTGTRSNTSSTGTDGATITGSNKSAGLPASGTPTTTLLAWAVIFLAAGWSLRRHVARP